MLDSYFVEWMWRQRNRGKNLFDEMLEEIKRQWPPEDVFKPNQVPPAAPSPLCDSASTAKGFPFPIICLIDVVWKTNPDGNCMFRAFSKHFFETEKFHQKIRDRSVKNVVTLDQL